MAKGKGKPPISRSGNPESVDPGIRETSISLKGEVKI